MTAKRRNTCRQDSVGFGKRFAAWRAKAGFSQDDLGSRIGLSGPAIAQWETEVTDPAQKNLRAAVRAMGITMAEFWGPLPGRAA